ncbi:MAG TPA: long-chain fatty acid--CoA ligase, partial [Burkholderiales bacterium]|nr:long-chain fatty acid--CoA ligase [Burkholderiales bacterium]
NVYPVEVEQVLDKIPEVKEAVVVGSIYEPTGERVNAFVVLKPNMSITESEIIKKCKKDLANYKIPHRIFIINELPKTLVGKIDKKRLSDKLKELS